MVEMPSQDLKSSTNSMKGRTTGKLKKTKIPLSIEDVFNEVSVVVATNENPPIGRTLLTPRSAEVCLAQGINPEILKIRDVDSFWEPGIDPTIQRMRHEAYVARRYDLMKTCRLERKKIINAHLISNAPASKAPPGAAGMTPEEILKAQEEATSTLIAQEQQRMKKMQERQEKELEQMLSYEVERAKVTAEMNKRIEEAAKKEEMRKKQREKRLKLMAEERRLREMQKVAQEEMEEARRRETAKRMFEKEKELQDKKILEEKINKRKAREADAEKRRKQQEHKAQVARYFAEEQMRLRKRLEDMQGAEVKKQAAIREKQIATAREVQLRRAMAEERISKNMEMARAVEQKRKDDFLAKQAHHDELRKVHLTQQEKERDLHAQEVLLAEQRRRMILIEKHRELEAKSEEMLQKFEEEEVHVEAVKTLRKKENDLLKEKSTLKLQMKKENVRRVSRMMEYKRMKTLKKIEDTDQRITTMVDQKQKLIEDRRKATQKTKLQKEKIAGLMEKVRSNASLAGKIVSQAMTGTMSLRDIMEKNAGDKSIKNKKSQKNLIMDRPEELPIMPNEITNGALDPPQSASTPFRDPEMESSNINDTTMITDGTANLSVSEENYSEYGSVDVSTTLPPVSKEFSNEESTAIPLFTQPQPEEMVTNSGFNAPPPTEAPVPEPISAAPDVPEPISAAPDDNYDDEEFDDPLPEPYASPYDANSGGMTVSL